LVFTQGFTYWVWHQPHFVALLAQLAIQEVRAAAGFHANQPDAQINGEPQQLRA
jgi:hypothetical protein